MDALPRPRWCQKIRRCCSCYCLDWRYYEDEDIWHPPWCRCHSWLRSAVRRIERRGWFGRTRQVRAMLWDRVPRQEIVAFIQEHTWPSPQEWNASTCCFPVSPLRYAAVELGDAAVTRAMCEAHANVNSRNRDGDSLLCRAYNEEVMEQLLRAGAAPDMPCRDSRNLPCCSITSPTWTWYFNLCPVCEVCCCITPTGITWYCCCPSHCPCCLSCCWRRVCGWGCRDCEEPYGFREREDAETTLAREMRYACQRSAYRLNDLQDGGHERIKALLRYGADPNQLTKHGTSVLFCACALGNPELVQLLLQSGATVTAGHMPPLLAKRTLLNPELCGLVLAHGANPNTTAAPNFRPSEGWTYEHLIDSGEHFIECVESLTPVGVTLMLLRKPARAAIPGAMAESMARTASELSEMSATGMEEIDEITAAVDDAHGVEAGESFNQAAVQVCDRLRKTLSLLLRHGADPNLLDGNGRPPLAYAILLEPPHREDVCAELMQAGADPGLLTKAIESDVREPHYGRESYAPEWERCMAKLQQMQLRGEFALTKSPVVGTASAVGSDGGVLITDGNAALGPAVDGTALPPVLGGLVGALPPALPMMGGTPVSPVVATPPQADHSF